MKTGYGINTVEVNGEIKHIHDLDPVTLSQEWTKLRKEVNSLYDYNRKVSKGWRGVILSLIGVKLPQKHTVVTNGPISTEKIS
jgi:hypothetical protein